MECVFANKNSRPLIKMEFAHVNQIFIISSCIILIIKRNQTGLIWKTMFLWILIFIRVQRMFTLLQ